MRGVVAEKLHITIVVLNTHDNPTQIVYLDHLSANGVRDFNTHLSA